MIGCRHADAALGFAAGGRRRGFGGARHHSAPSEQAGRPDQQHDDHDGEDHGIRRLGEKHFGQALDNAKREAGQDRAHDRPHAADDDHREHDDDQIGAHLRRYVIDRRRHDAGERRESDAEAIGQRHHARHVDAEGAHQRRVFGRSAQIGAEPRPLDREPGGKTHHERERDHPGAVIGQEHEAEIASALQRIRHRIGLPRRAVIIAEQAFDDQRQAEGEQESVERIEAAQLLQQHPLDDDAERADQDRHDHQRRPIIDAEILQQHIGDEGAHHVLRAVGEIDDVEHAENDGEPETQERVERAVDQAEQKLAEQRLRRDAEDFEHALNVSRGNPAAKNLSPRGRGEVDRQLVIIGQLSSFNGRNASSAAMVARSL